MEPWLIFANYLALGAVLSLLSVIPTVKKNPDYAIGVVLLGCLFLALAWPFFFGYFFLKGLFRKT